MNNLSLTQKLIGTILSEGSHKGLTVGVQWELSGDNRSQMLNQRSWRHVIRDQGLRTGTKTPSGDSMFGSGSPQANKESCNPISLLLVRRDNLQLTEEVHGLWAKQ